MSFFQKVSISIPFSSSLPSEPSKQAGKGGEKVDMRCNFIGSNALPVKFQVLVGLKWLLKLSNSKTQYLNGKLV
jgi:hypothetical protein